MHVLCPRCHSPIAMTQVEADATIACPACGSTFTLATGGTTHGGEALPPGRKIGKYEVMAEVAHGAFGTVYKALDAELERTVAIKVPRAGSMMSSVERDRFLREARSAAQLRHPAIVTVYEVGTHDGVPFLVSDFVEGITLADYLSAQRPTPPEAAHLCIALAEALHFAHLHGIVHRDVKPSNVMLERGVRSKESEARSEISRLTPVSCLLTPRLMDFGLAKRDTGEATMTVEGQILGTPAYLSPEQARGTSHAVDGRSDVYSLGVVLYQLLTGEVPFRGTTRMLLHQVLHDEPRPPRTLNDQVPFDLQTVCLKAMAKEPGRRYATALALADDLRRFVNGEPIHAHPVGRSERAWRWCRRNPREAVLMGTLALVLVGATAGMSLLWLRSEQQRKEAIAQRQRAEENYRQARQAINDLYDRVNKPLSDLPGTHPVRSEILNLALQQYQHFVRAHSDDPTLQAELARTHWRLAVVQQDLGLTKEALAGYEKALQVQESLVRTHPDHLPYLDDLASTCNNLALQMLADRQPTRAATLLQRASELRSRLAELEPDNPQHQRDLASIHGNFGHVWLAQGKPKEAGAAHEKCLQLREVLWRLDATDPDYQHELAKALMNVGAWRVESGQYDDSFAYFQRAKQLWDDLRPRYAAQEIRHGLAQVNRNIGHHHKRAKRVDEAVAAYRESEAISDELARQNPNVPEFRQLTEETGRILGQFLMDANRHVEALPVLVKSAAMQEALLRDGHALPKTRLLLAQCLNNIGALHQQKDRNQEALPAFQRTIALFEELLAAAPGNRDYLSGLALAYLNLGATQSESGDNKAALESYALSEKRYQELLPAEPEHPDFLRHLTALHENRGIVYEKLQSRSDAATAYQEALRCVRLALKRAPNDGELLEKQRNYEDFIKQLKGGSTSP